MDDVFQYYFTKGINYHANNDFVKANENCQKALKLTLIILIYPLIYKH